MIVLSTGDQLSGLLTRCTRETTINGQVYRERNDDNRHQLLQKITRFSDRLESREIFSWIIKSCAYNDACMNQDYLRAPSRLFDRFTQSIRDRADTGY